MDPELRAYLQEQRTSFRELTTAVQELRSDFQEQKEQLQELRSDVQEQKKQFQGLRSDFQEQKEQLQEQKNQLQGLRVYLDERFEQVDRRFEKVDRRFEKVEESDCHTRILIEDLRGELQLVAEGVVGIQESREADRAEIMREIGDVKSLLITSYSDLNRRVLSLEDWRERRDRGPIAVLREWLAKPR